uniref:Uncharacterized protein n=1 Tax=Morchella brunnea TaxID=1174671 RepID=A0A8K1I7V8_9PEZI|nr:hypothetical protein LK370_mgp025 [Morchella brunnea]UBU98459.1 hypothetical protein [Morchella brunnea]
MREGAAGSPPGSVHLHTLPTLYFLMEIYERGGGLSGWPSPGERGGGAWGGADNDKFNFSFYYTLPALVCMHNFVITSRPGQRLDHYLVYIIYIVNLLRWRWVGSTNLSSRLRLLLICIRIKFYWEIKPFHF